MIDKHADKHASREPVFSIITPVLCEHNTINRHVDALYSMQTGFDFEIIIVDGDTGGSTLRALDKYDVQKLKSPAGRASQMNCGARHARGSLLVFLHADTCLPANALDAIFQVLSSADYVGGAFSLSIDSRTGNSSALRLIAAAASLRSRITRIPYGDQAFFFRKECFFMLGGYRNIPLMEDVDIMKRVKRQGGAICILADKVVTSARRWERDGIIRGTLRNWFVYVLYCIGVSPGRLARLYPP